VFVRGFEAGGWTGIDAPRNTPANIIGTLNKEINCGAYQSADRRRGFTTPGVTCAGMMRQIGSIPRTKATGRSISIVIESKPPRMGRPSKTSGVTVKRSGVVN